jgi:hypothetical protein
MAEREGTSVVEDVRRITQETTYRNLINLRDDELTRRFDLLLSVGDYELTIDHYRDEIQRREIAKQNQRLELLTGGSSCSPSCREPLRSCRGSPARH